MPRLSALFTNVGVPLTAPANVPTIRIRRQDTGALVVTDAAMTEQGDGLFTYDFTESPTLEYVFRCDGDPTAAGQVTIQERYVGNSFSGITELQIESIEDIAFGDAVHIDTVNGTAGTAWPIGTPTSPVDNLANAITIAAARGLRKFVLAGSITLVGALANWRIEGVAANNLISVVDINGQNVAGTEFNNVALTGTSLGFFTGRRCEFFGTLNGIQGFFENCTLLGTLTPAANAPLWLLNCYSGIAGLSTPTLDLTNMTTGGSANVRTYSGGLAVMNCNVGAFVSTFEFVAGQIVLAASLTAGTFAVRGIVKITDSSAGATIVDEAALARTPIQSLILADATPFNGADIAAILTDTGTTLPALIAALNDLSIADVQTALTNQGYTAGRAPNLDNLDAAISTVVAAIAALNDIGIADVQTALTNQGYTAGRAPNLDYLDAAITAVIAAIAALNDIDIADVQTALTNQGYTAGRAPNLDNLDAAITSRATVAAILAAVLAGSGESVDDALSRLDNIDTSVTTTIPGLITGLNDISAADVWSVALPGAFGAGTAGYIVGNKIQILVDHHVARRRIDTTTTPWQIVTYKEGQPASELSRKDLKDQDGNDITDANNPLVDPSVMFSEEDPV